MHIPKFSRFISLFSTFFLFFRNFSSLSPFFSPSFLHSLLLIFLTLLYIFFSFPLTQKKNPHPPQFLTPPLSFPLISLPKFPHHFPLYPFIVPPSLPSPFFPSLYCSLIIFLHFPHYTHLFPSLPSFTYFCPLLSPHFPLPILTLTVPLSPFSPLSLPSLLLSPFLPSSSLLSPSFHLT